eukprot:Trichotokara_eunicae@DN5390_c0_g1_i14.p1
MVLVLRDGRIFRGRLRTFDTFGNLVITECFEIFIELNKYAELYMGVFVVRGENLSYCGTLDEEFGAELEEAPLGEILGFREEFGSASQKLNEILED